MAFPHGTRNGEYFCPFRFDICSIDFNAIECLMAVGGFLGFSLLLLQPTGGLGVMRRRRQACLTSMKHWQQTDGPKDHQQQKRVFTRFWLKKQPSPPEGGSWWGCSWSE